MVGHSALFVSTSSQVLSPCSITHASGNGSLNLFPCSTANLRHKRKKLFVIKDSAEQNVSSSESKSPLLVVINFTRAIWRQTFRPLSDFGFGRKSVWEGGVGLFLVSGTVLFVLSLAWLRGFQLRSKFRKYLAVFEFDQASGISTGTSVRIRGINVGTVVSVNPSLRRIEAVVEVRQTFYLFYTNARSDMIVCHSFLSYFLF